MTIGFQAADRALQMLEAFDGPRKEVGVSDLADLIGIHRSTASRLAATLEQRGFLERVPGRRTYQLGATMGRLGLIALGGRDLRSSSQSVMEALADRSTETVNLAKVDGDGTEIVNILQIDGKHLVGVGSWTGRRTSAHCVANGKVLLAFGAARLPTQLPAFTARTITTQKALMADLEKVRRVGYATNIGEAEEGLHAVAAPIFDAFGKCVAALSVSAPAFRVPIRRLPELAEACVMSATEISRALGSPAHAQPKRVKAKS